MDDTFFNALSAIAGQHWDAILCRTAAEAIGFLKYYRNNANIIIDLDHDLGEGHEMDNNLVASGYDICKYIVEHQIPLVGFHIHSINPSGSFNMRQLLTHYGYKEL